MRNRLFAILAAMSVTVVGWIVQPALGHNHGALPSFSDADKDRNGFISGKEYQSVPGLSKDLVELDKDGDNKVSMAEYSSLNALPLQVLPRQLRAPNAVDSAH